MRITKKTWHHFDIFEPYQLPGLYAIYMENIITERYRLIYIGTATNLERRLNKNHDIFSRKIKIPYQLILKLKYIKENRLKTEKKLIKRLKPILNKTYNK